MEFNGWESPNMMAQPYQHYQHSPIEFSSSPDDPRLTPGSYTPTTTYHHHYHGEGGEELVVTTTSPTLPPGFSSNSSSPSDTIIRPDARERVVHQQFSRQVEKFLQIEFAAYESKMWKSELSKVLNIVLENYSKLPSSAWTIEEFIKILLSSQSQIPSSKKNAAEDMYIVALRACVELISLPDLQPVNLSEFADLLIREMLDIVLRQAPHRKPQIEQIRQSYLHRNSGNHQKTMKITQSPGPVDYDVLEINIPTFESLRHQLFEIEDGEYLRQVRKQTELLLVFSCLSEEQKLDCFTKFCGTEVPEAGGTMWQMKLLLWVLSEILQRMMVIPPTVQPELERLFKKLINNSSKQNLLELISLRQQFNKLLPDFIFQSIDSTATKRYATWIQLVVCTPEKNRFTFLETSVQEMFQIQKTLTDFDAYVKYRLALIQHQQNEFIQAALAMSIQEPLPLQLSSSPSQFHLPTNRDSKKPVIRPTDDLRIIDDIPQDDENCVDYDHFDRNILFSPVPRNPSDLELDAHRRRKMKSSHHPKRKIVVPPPRSDIAEFLKMCKEESVRIRAEEIAPQPSKRSSDESNEEDKRANDGGAGVVAKKAKKYVVGGSNRTKGLR